MGVYLSGMSTASFAFGGSYCLSDITWRVSKWCSLLGAVFNMSSHGSLIFIAYLTFTRVYKCLRPFSRGTSIITTIVASVCIHVLTTVNAFIFIVPSKYLRDLLLSQIHVSNGNPYMEQNHSNVENVNRLFQVYYPSEVENVSGVLERLEMLRNMTNMPKLFDHVSYSFYSHSPNCVPNMYNSQSYLKAYNMCYIAFIASALLQMSVNYTVILYIAKKSRCQAGSSQESAGSASLITFKVALTICVKIVTWVIIISPINIIMYYLTGSLMKDTTYEAIHILVIPLNSVLNPICNTGLLKRILYYSFIKVRAFSWTICTEVGEMEKAQCHQCHCWR